MPWPNLLNVGRRKKPLRLPLLLECLLCKNKFTVEDASKKRLYIRTMICRNCYKQGAQSSAKVWCFGKLKAPRVPGYSPENLSCRLLCPDRVICRQFIKKLTKENK